MMSETEAALYGAVLYYGAWLLVPFALVLLGMFLGNKLGPIRRRLLVGSLLTALPPATVAGLYWWASGSGCSGGDCTGAMFALMGLGLLAALPVCVGIGTLLSSVFALLMLPFRKA